MPTALDQQPPSRGTAPAPTQEDDATPLVLSQSLRFRSSDSGSAAATQQVLREFSILKKENARLRDRSEKFHMRSKVLRQQLVIKDKKLVGLARTVAAFSAEKATAEAEKARDKRYLQQLESRAVELLPAAELEETVRELQAELNSKSAILRSKGAAAQLQEQTVAALRSALQIKATEMSHSSGQDIKSSLLICLAKSRDEKACLAQCVALQHDELKSKDIDLAEYRTNETALRKQLANALMFGEDIRTTAKRIMQASVQSGEARVLEEQEAIKAAIKAAREDTEHCCEKIYLSEAQQVEARHAAAQDQMRQNIDAMSAQVSKCKKDVAAARQDRDAALEQADTIRQQLGDQKTLLQNETKIRENLKQQLEVMETQVAIVKAEAFKRERRLKERLEASLLETSDLVSQRNALKAALQDMQAAARRRL